MQLNRRAFVKLVTTSGIALTVSRLGDAQQPTFHARETMPPPGTWNPSLTGKGRVDGFAKVTGAKLYASDFRAADMPGWPTQTSHALLLRSSDATHVYQGLELSALPANAKPAVVIGASDLARANIRVPEFYKGDLLCPVGKTPLYLGQPVALLIFDTFDAFDRARVILREKSPLRFGHETPAAAGAPYGANRFTRVAGPDPRGPDVFSPLQSGWATPIRYQKAEMPVWAPGNRRGDLNARASFHGERIRNELRSPSPDVLVLERDFTTQSVDPMFLEPEAGLAWYDTGKKRLEIVLGTQSPDESGEAIADLLGAARDGMKPASIDAQFAYIGGGFGGRDHTPLPLYIALAAMFYPGRPVRLANDRFEQFQSGIKRHPFKMHTWMGFDRKTGEIRAFAADHVLDGGGLANFSASVADVGATGAIGIYDIPKVDVTTVAQHSRGVTAGSMRGYGTLQTMTALEVIVDEAAVALRIDPIELRRRNALVTGDRNMTGNPYVGPVRTPELLDKLAACAVWRDRAAEKSRAPAGAVVGTGIACVTKDYGAGADCTQVSIELDAAGNLSIVTDAVEMGTAIGTALANRAALTLGRVATAVDMSRPDAFAPLGLKRTVNSYVITQAQQDAAARDPRWVPEISSPSSASIGAHITTHGAHEAGKILFRFGLWPAALALWKIPRADPRAARPADAKWVDGALVLEGHPPLPLADLARQLHATKGLTGVMVHGFNRWAWASATFTIAGQPYTSEIDALALRQGDGAFARLTRRNVKFPPSVYNRIGTAYSAGSAAAVRVTIDRATGNLRIAKAYSVVECGTSLVPEVVRGQMQGGFAMGVGYALLESLPPFEDGPGNGKWNLGAYTVARISDVPPGVLDCEILPPLTPDDPPKGMAEVVMIPIVPALLNAIFDATGKRFDALPVTADMLRKALA